uniref:Transmembrane protein 242 n=1 Tax=Phaeomonas parva TaxID=124430 RepID=A0A7S1TQU5_9STRA|mmetsp:Transcript_12667/g.37971  ORF Transcript_12667/g.37971 Transcript_12667/m.37971 type:complete len:203 (+) Transcript_12667:148-756(+)
MAPPPPPAKRAAEPEEVAPTSWYWGLGLAYTSVFSLGIFAGFRYQLATEERMRKQGKGVKMIRAKPFDMKKTKAVPIINPYMHAAKALAAGTALCLGVSSVLVLGAGWAMGVSSMEEFADVMKVWVPAQHRRIEAATEAIFGVRPNAEAAAERELMGTMTRGEQEDYLWRKIEAGFQEQEAQEAQEGDAKAKATDDKANVLR